MAIYGIGTDVTDVGRIARALDRFGKCFGRRILTERERERMPCRPDRRAEYVAARFAAKEAVVKALGTGFAFGIGPMDVEVVKDEAGRPSVELHGAAAEAARARGITAMHLSLSHAGGQALAFAVAEL